MTGNIPEAELSRLSDLIAALTGLHFPKARWHDLELGINAAAPELGMGDGQSCIQLLLSSPAKRKYIEILASHLTVSETYFFRDKQLFKALKEATLPGVIRRHRENGKCLRIWSAGCSSGEEPYSIAILLDQMLPDIAEWDITILATDINTRYLQKAVEGVYGSWSFRNVEPEIKEKYFTPREDGGLEIHSRFRDMVTFSYLNLVQDIYPSSLYNTNALDLILCRNVLMYFVPEALGRVVRGFHRCLVTGGFLIVSPSELSSVNFSQFTAVRTTGTVIYQKRNAKKASAPPGDPPGTPKPKKPAVHSLPFSAPSSKPASTTPAISSQADRADKEVSKADGNSLKDLFQRAFSLYQEGSYPESVEKIEEILSQNQSHAKALALLARIYANWGRLDEAFKWCKQAISSEKLDPGHHYLLASILQEMGRTEEALASLEKTLYLDPKFVPAHVALGNISRKTGRHKESLKYFRSALSILEANQTRDILFESEEINPRRLIEIIRTTLRTEFGSRLDE